MICFTSYALADDEFDPYDCIDDASQIDPKIAIGQATELCSAAWCNEPAKSVVVETLKKEITSLKEAKAEYQSIAKSYKGQNEKLWEHIQQVYNMYDEMLAERNGFAERLRHMN